MFRQPQMPMIKRSIWMISLLNTFELHFDPGNILWLYGFLFKVQHTF